MKGPKNTKKNYKENAVIKNYELAYFFITLAFSFVTKSLKTFISNKNNAL